MWLLRVILMFFVISACSNPPERQPIDRVPEVDAGVCGDDLDCPGGRCLDGVCSQGDAGPSVCGENGDCPQGQRCDNGRCVRNRCVRDGDCSDNELCDEGWCTPGERPPVRLAAEPASVAVSFQNAEDVVQTQVALINRGTSVINIEEVTMMGSFAFSLETQPQVPLRLVPEQHIQLVVIYRADDLVPDEATLWLRTDQSAQTQLEVPLVSFTKNPEVEQPTPCLSVTPSSLQFGAVPRGQQEDRTFVLEGCGDEPVTVSGINRGRTFFAPLSDAFSLVAPPAFPLSLGRGDQHTITVRYTSGRAGDFFGYWDVRSDDAQSPSQRVNVRAETERPPITGQGLHIRMTWSTDLNDIDMHLLAPGGSFFECPGDCYFGNRGPDWGQQGDFADDPFLDLDDVDGHGPENINIEEPQAGTYTLIAHHYDDHDAWDVPQVTFEVFSYGQLVGTYGPTNLAQVSGTWDAVEIDWVGGGVAPTLRPLGQVGARRIGNGCR
jgi:hypothetical protein